MKTTLKENLIMLLFSSLSENRKYYILRRVRESIKEQSEIKIKFVEVN